MIEIKVARCPMIKRGAVLVLCLLATGYVEPKAALAGDGDGICGGKLIDQVLFRDQVGNRIGQLQFYYNATNGNNCAVMYHRGVTWGKSAFTAVSLATGSRQLAAENGNFRHQAGPVRAFARNLCVAAYGGIRHNGTTYSMGTPFHCK